ncbi:MAG: hypothetical protein ACQCN4_08835 [Candidatus Bathyarchaeia archaeon]|jgi:hypothetical protein
MKALLIAIAASLLFVLTVAEVERATAIEEFPYPLVSKFSIISPLNSTYSATALTLNVTANALPGYTRIWMSYNIDGRQQEPIQITETYDPHYGTITYLNGTAKTAPSMFSTYSIQGYATLTDLSEGSHNITVYAEYDYPNTKEFDYQTADRLITADHQTITYLDNSTISFTISNEDSSLLPNLSVENRPRTNPNTVFIGGDLTANPSHQQKDNISELNMSMAIAITVAVSVVALALLVFKKTRK